MIPAPRGSILPQQTPRLRRTRRNCSVLSHQSLGTAASRWRDFTSVPGLGTVKCSLTLAVRDMLHQLTMDLHLFYITARHFLRLSSIDHNASSCYWSMQHISINQGNKNNFHSEEACQKFCAPVMVKESPVTTVTTPAPQSVCSLPAKKGSCQDHLLRYHYVPEKEDCLEFLFSGCGVRTF